MERLVLVLLGLGFLAIQVPLQDPAMESGAWELASLNLDVTVHPEAQRLEGNGTLSVRAPTDGLTSLTLVLAPERGRFETITGSDGMLPTITETRDTAHVRLQRPPRAGQLVTLHVRWHIEGDVGRDVAIRAEGTLASWGGTWYPALGGTATGVPNRIAVGTTRLRVPEGWRTLSNGKAGDQHRYAGTTHGCLDNGTPAGAKLRGRPIHGHMARR